ncbi:MAG: cation:dicarboxylate symporter family transporter [Lactovum sp.]
MKKLSLLIKLLIGIAVGAIFGLVTDSLQKGIIKELLLFIIGIFSTFNSIFGSFLSFMIPLIILSLVSVGLADLGKKANKLFAVTLLLSYISSVGAGLVAFLIGKAFLPILLQGVTFSSKIDEGNAISPFFTIEMPVIFGVMTALILSFILGLGMANIEEKFLLGTLKNLKEIVTLILGKIIIPLIPFHISGLFMNISAQGKLASTIRLFAVLYLMIIILQLLYIIFQFLLSTSYTKRNFFQSIKLILPAYFTALGTQSSAATIPVSVECAYKAESDKDIVDFAIPLCATIHLAGDTIALTLGAMGIMMINGQTVEMSSFLPYIFMLGVIMVAAPGIPGGGVMAALGLLTDMLSFTAGMQDLMITLHFSQDSFGTATNVSGDQALCQIVNKYSQKSKKILKENPIPS